MIPFFKKKASKPTVDGKDSTITPNEVTNDIQDTKKDKEVQPKLSLHPSWKLSREDVYVFQYLNLECPPLKLNQLSLHGINITKEFDSMKVTAFVRSSLTKPYKLSKMSLILLDKDNNLIGKKLFNLSELGTLPPKSSRPWEFIFNYSDLTSQELPSAGWKLAFQLSNTSRKHSLEFEDSWNKSLATEDKEKFINLFNSIEPPKQGEVNFMGLNAKMSEAGSLHVTMLIRNGSNKSFRLEQIPLQVEDANGVVIAKGGFKLENFNVNANTSKPWTFIFPKTMVTTSNPDLSTWKAYTPS